MSAASLSSPPERYTRLLSLKNAVKLEASGMTPAPKASARKTACRELKLDLRTKSPAVIFALDLELAKFRGEPKP